MSPNSEDLKADVVGLLRKYDLKPQKGLGQNFLISDSALKKIIQAADILTNDAVLEIGPGLGALTRYLAKASRRVVAVELDNRLLLPLKESIGKSSNVTVLHGDILDCDVSKVMRGEEGYVVVANIPYYITSAVIRHLLTAAIRPRSITLTVQEEVAERICEGAGKHSLLSLGVQVFGQPEIRARIPAGAFYPPPKVDSAVVHVELFERPLVDAEGIEDFFMVARAGFSQKRKNLRNSLSGGLGLAKEAVESLLLQAGIDSGRRAQTLSISEWLLVAEAYRDARGPSLR
ncbi:MAG: ribosomal RNA small subunit methyltransferase A [Anaerolineae bacterium]|nr:MAG: ribosomal RNA small subunit methyltransferase A [Anaerolineae bacterium]